MSKDEEVGNSSARVHRHVWGATQAEERALYRCDEVLPHAPGRWLRAVSSSASPAAVYRRLCQLRAAPYSYDLLDNWGRPSPPELLAWCDAVEPGQRVMTIFTAESVQAGRELTLRMNPGAPTSVFGDLALTYRVNEAGPDGGSRLVAAMRVCDGPGPGARVRRRVLAWGDLMMMRKQLLTLAALAESDEAAGAPPPRGNDPESAE